MPYDLLLPQQLRQSGWRIKIFDFERLEEPHVTICRKTQMWRVSLRSGQFLDRGVRWSQINKEIGRIVEAEWMVLRTEWDRLHPDNPIEGQPDDREEAEDEADQ